MFLSLGRVAAVPTHKPCVSKTFVVRHVLARAPGELRAADPRSLLQGAIKQMLVQGHSDHRRSCKPGAPVAAGTRKTGQSAQADSQPRVVPFLSLFFFGKVQGNPPPKKTRIFCPCRSPKIPGKERENAQKTRKQGIPRRHKEQGIPPKQGKEGQGDTIGDKIISSTHTFWGGIYFR